MNRHVCKLSDSLLRQIEHVLPKLKYSVYIQQIKYWLENFEENDVPFALDFLFFLEYITFSELQVRMDEQLRLLDKRFGKSKKLVLVSFAEYPKSNDIVMYLISKSPTYKYLRNQNRASITTDIHNEKLDYNSVLVFVDDFIGSGKSFHKWYKKREYLICIIGTLGLMIYRLSWLQ